MLAPKKFYGTKSIGIEKILIEHYRELQNLKAKQKTVPLIALINSKKSTQ
jgi:hypothetical protein